LAAQQRLKFEELFYIHAAYQIEVGETGKIQGSGF